MTNSGPPAGWYPDPTGKPGNVYWDGGAWQATLPATSGAVEQPATGPSPGEPVPPPAATPQGSPAFPGPSGFAQAPYQSPTQYGPLPNALAPKGSQSTAPAWTATKSFGLYSLIIGFAGFLLDFLCGIGVVVSIISTIVGVVALMRARKYNEPQGLAISGIVVGVLNIVFVFVVFVFLGSLSQMQF